MPHNALRALLWEIRRSTNPKLELANVLTARHCELNNRFLSDQNCHRACAEGFSCPRRLASIDKSSLDNDFALTFLSGLFQIRNESNNAIEFQLLRS